MLDMAVNILSPEQVEELKRSPYVASATSRQVSFNIEFKKMFYEEYSNGKTPREILAGVGIDADALGESRVYSIRMHCLQQANSESGFTDRKAQWEPTKIRGRKRCADERIDRLEHELAYTRQELEFLKKIMFADREAQGKCELKQRRRPSSGSSEK